MHQILMGAVSAADRLHHATIREIRKGHDHLLLGVVTNVAQTILLVGVFYVVSVFSGFGTAMIRGDLLIYLITGVFLFNLHVKTVGAVLSSDGPGSPIMAHGPMSTSISIAGAAIGCLYTQVYAGLIVLGLYYALISPVSLHQPFGLAGCFLLSWLFGAAVGLVLLALKPGLPKLAGFLSQAYSRINMIGSGQMFVANMLPAQVLAYFQWNPLFHIVDQARGFAFLNYNPWFSNLFYPTIAAAVMLVLGLLAEGRVSARPAAG